MSDADNHKESKNLCTQSTPWTVQNYTTDAKMLDVSLPGCHGDGPSFWIAVLKQWPMGCFAYAYHKSEVGEDITHRIHVWYCKECINPMLGQVKALHGRMPWLKMGTSPMA